MAPPPKGTKKKTSAKERRGVVEYTERARESIHIQLHGHRREPHRKREGGEETEGRRPTSSTWGLFFLLLFVK